MPSEQSNEKVRVVIPAHKALGTIDRCITAVAAQSTEIRPEIIVVSNDGEPAALTRLLQHQPCTVIVSDKMGSAAAARNKGAAGFAAGILVFIDADVEISAGSLAQLALPVARGACAAAVGNYSFDVSGLTFAEAFKQLYVAKVYSRKVGEIRNEFWSAFGAVRAEIFHALGGFDDSISGAGGEDTTFGYALSQAGHGVMAIPSAGSKHLHRFSVGGIIRNDFKKGCLTVRNRWLRGVPLSTNRHISKRDICAVIAAALTTILLVLAIATGSDTLTALVLFFFGVFVLARLELYSLHSSRGLLFLLKAAPLTFLLDLIRASCIPIGTMQVLWSGRRKVVHVGNGANLPS